MFIHLYKIHFSLLFLIGNNVSYVLYSEITVKIQATAKSNRISQ